MIFFLYQNASTSGNQEASPQGLISSIKYIQGKVYRESGFCDEFKVTQFGQKMQQKLIFLFPFICYIYFMQKRTLGTKNALQRHYSERKTCFRPAAVLQSIARYVLCILQRFSYKKVGKCNAKNLLKTYYKKFQKFEKQFILSHRPFFLNVTRDIQFSTYLCATKRTIFFW